MGTLWATVTASLVDNQALLLAIGQFALQQWREAYLEGEHLESGVVGEWFEDTDLK